MSNSKVRCAWLNLNNPLYVKYHDEEWGEAEHDDQKLFELLSLECFQAGLSWECVLNKRRDFRSAFDNFKPEKVAAYDESRVMALCQNAKLIRHEQKIKAVVNNAAVFLEIQKQFKSFDAYLWHFTDGKIIRELNQSSSKLSDTVASDLKKRGMKFVGSVTVYAFLCAAGVINAHDENCFKAPNQLTS